MLRCWLGDVGECEGRGMWRTECGVGIGVVDTDIPGPEEGGRRLVDGVLLDAALDSCWEPWWLFAFEDVPLLAIVWRIVNCGVLEVLVGSREGMTVVLLDFRDTACQGDTAGGVGCGFSIVAGIPSC